MTTFDTQNIRNVAVIGHGGEGKTTLCEAILYNAKTIDRLGKVADGTSCMDFDEQEIARKISMSAGICYAVWENVKINLLDVPGFFDFEGEFIQALCAADSGLVVIAANGSVPVGVEKAMDALQKKGLPAMIFVNQMDKENADYLGTVRALEEKYPHKIAPISIPLMEGPKMAGYINVLERTAFRFTDAGPKQVDVPAEYAEELEQILSQLNETAAENDDDLLEKFFSGEALTPDEVKQGVTKGIANRSVYPLLAGSALTNKGVFNLMSEIVRVMPAPDARKTVMAEDEKGEPVEIACKTDAPFAAQVFKTVADPFVGKLNFFKVVSGSVKSGANLWNANKEKAERVSSVLIPKGKKQETAEQLNAGDIGAFAKLAVTGTGDTLCDPARKVKFPAIEFPKPVLSMCIAAAKTGDEDKVFSGLNKLAEEDLTFSVSKNADTNQAILSGLGETQLDVLCKKLKSKFNADAVLSVPAVPYRETIRKTIQAEGKHKKQSGGHGQYGHCKIRFEPCEEGFEFADEVVGGTVPKNYIPAVEKGLRECLNKGVLAGCPVTGLRAVLYDGSFHPVDSSEEAFKVAAHLAFKELKNASPVLLEPIYSLEIRVPENYIGDIMGDLNKRRGRILGMDSGDGFQVIHAEAPLAEVFTYATDLRSMTQGRGSFSMAEARYEEVPAMLVGKIVEKLNAEREK